jgi:hypothetical protein
MTMRWITRENIKVDRVACPWLTARFVDKDAEFLFVPEGELLETARRETATPFDAMRFAEVALNHRGDRCVATTGTDRPFRRREGTRVRSARGHWASRDRARVRGVGHF